MGRRKKIVDAVLDAKAQEDSLNDGALCEENPFGWGEGTTPPGRVRFLRFLTWSTSPTHLVSLRDTEGSFLAPGFFAAIQATRSATTVTDTLRQQARQKGIQLFMQSLFVPVVYPDVVPFRYWQHCTNPFDHTLVTLHYLHKKILESQVRRHFAGAIPKDRRFVMGDLSTLLLRNRTVFNDFFSDPANAQCRGIVWRGPAGTLLGQSFPHFTRLISYAILRPEWIMDAQPVSGAPDLIGDAARKSPATCLKRVQKLLITTEAALKTARLNEERRSEYKRRKEETEQAEDAGL